MLRVAKISLRSFGEFRQTDARLHRSKLLTLQYRRRGNGATVLLLERFGRAVSDAGGSGR